MSSHRSWPVRALAVASLVAVITSSPAAAKAADAIRHPEGTLKLAERQLVVAIALLQIDAQVAAHVVGQLHVELDAVAGEAGEPRAVRVREVSWLSATIDK